MVAKTTTLARQLAVWRPSTSGQTMVSMEALLTKCDHVFGYIANIAIIKLKYTYNDIG